MLQNNSRLITVWLDFDAVSHIGVIITAGIITSLKGILQRTPC